jgi:hypothetical protein
MKNFNIVVLLFLVLVAKTVLAANPAFAHGFKVALLLPPSSVTPLEGRQIRQGFMVATAERDSHPDQESDGHLGGLDVYVSVLDQRGDAVAGIRRVMAGAEVDIVAVFGSARSLSVIRGLLAGSNIALLLPGQLPIADPGLPAIARFASAYETAYRDRPSELAARGYHAARRIDAGGAGARRG